MVVVVVLVDIVAVVVLMVVAVLVMAIPPLNLTKGPFQFQLKLNTFRVRNSSLTKYFVSEEFVMRKVFKFS